MLVVGTMIGMQIGGGRLWASPITLGLGWFFSLIREILFQGLTYYLPSPFTAMGGRMLGQKLYDVVASDCEEEQQRKNPYEHGSNTYL